MKTLTCDKYPELSIHDLGVEFHAGVAHVGDEFDLTTLVPLMNAYGIETDDLEDDAGNDDDQEQEQEQEPPKRGRRA